VHNKAAKPIPVLDLVGRWFHAFGEAVDPETGRKGWSIQYQGMVCGKVAEGVYLVQFAEWLTDCRDAMRLVTVDEMRDWQFYIDNEHMIDWQERHPKVLDYMPPAR
jgi:hypothetical protein